jgi:hypothetical protein
MEGQRAQGAPVPPSAARTATRPLLDAVPDPDLARAAWAHAHGMVVLELAGRFPPGADVGAAWRAAAAAFTRGGERGIE